MSTTTKVWFITGTSSGFGRLMVEHVLKQGDIAVATLRSLEVLSDLAKQYGPEKLLILKVDVARAQEIKDALAAGVKQFGRIDVVFNNASYALAAEAEAVPDDVARAQLDVTLWGAIDVSKEAVRVFRDINKPAGGRLLQNTSGIAIQSFAGMSYYGAAKSALASFSEAISQEMDPDWNIKIIIVQPGAFRTSAQRNLVRLPGLPAYDKVMSGPRAILGLDEIPNASDPVKGVEIMYKIAALADPPLFLPLGPDCVEYAKKRYATMLENTNAVAGWSDSLKEVS